MHWRTSSPVFRMVVGVVVTVAFSRPGVAQLTARDDPANPDQAATWAKAADSDPFEIWGLDSKETKVIVINLRIIWAANNPRTDHSAHGKLTDGTAAKEYQHAHLWDTNKDDFSGKTKDTTGALTTNQELSDRYWDKRFGVDYAKGTGEIDGGAITREAVGNLKQDCSCYGMTYTGCQGTWKYALVKADQISLAVTTVCTQPAANTVKAKDLLGYGNGSWGLGIHITVVDAAAAKKPSSLRWKYMISGIYVQAKKKNEWDTPVYFGKAGNMTDDPSTWTLSSTGAGDSASAGSALFRPK